ncbi:hypothetical protein L6164_036596 [Bauhinia variegata]|uniref:Uncharacterized protein n=1 Tax=Bauhinia variegata TaxID=167791 RepID=A0ACB9KHI0_BAUVA|nr:hypothetical protein L6164_036596 [Bauhinia variegata]
MYLQTVCLLQPQVQENHSIPITSTGPTDNRPPASSWSEVSTSAASSNRRIRSTDSFTPECPAILQATDSASWSSGPPMNTMRICMLTSDNDPRPRSTKIPTEQGGSFRTLMMMSLCALWAVSKEPSAVKCL